MPCRRKCCKRPSCSCRKLLMRIIQFLMELRFSDITSFFDKPEKILRKQLEYDKLYPFHEVQRGVYAFTVRPSKFPVYIFLALFSCAVIIHRIIIRRPFNEFFLCIILWCVASVMQAFSFRKKNHYVIDQNEVMYEYYDGKTLRYRGHLHNIYIRLEQLQSFAEEQYHLVIDGFMTEKYRITGYTTDKGGLQRLGRQMAETLDINYFDSEDVSPRHVIRHWCPYSETIQHAEGASDQYSAAEEGRSLSQFSSNKGKSHTSLMKRKKGSDATQKGKAKKLKPTVVTPTQSSLWSKKRRDHSPFYSSDEDIGSHSPYYSTEEEIRTHSPQYSSDDEVRPFSPFVSDSSDEGGKKERPKKTPSPQDKRSPFRP